MNDALFFSTIRKSLFNRLTKKQVAGMNGLLEAFVEVGDRDQDTLAYALATAFHETNRAMIPNRENMNYTTVAQIRKIFGKYIKTDAEAKRYVRQPKQLANRVYNGRLGNFVGSDDGWIFRGGGHPHLTGRTNYANSSKDAGVDLVKNPEAMLDPKISARVLIKGILDGRWNARGHGLDFYAGADDFLSVAEAKEARRTVNLLDQSAAIAGYHRKFYDALTTAGWTPMVRPDVPETEAKTAGGFLLWLLSLFMKG